MLVLELWFWGVWRALQVCWHCMMPLRCQTKVLVGHIGYGNAVVLQQGTASKVPATDGSGSFQVSCVPEAEYNLRKLFADLAFMLCLLLVKKSPQSQKWMIRRAFLKHRDCVISGKAFRVAGRLDCGEGICIFFGRQYRQIWNDLKLGCRACSWIKHQVEL